MNPVLIILILLGGALLWLLLSFLFIPIGKAIWRLIEDARKSMLEEQEEKKG